jgi:transposase
MSKARVAVLHVVSGQLTVTAAAKTYGFSRQHLHRLLKRYREGGLEAVDARSRRPASNPRAVTDDVIVAVVRLRENLVDQGHDIRGDHRDCRWGISGRQSLLRR